MAVAFDASSESHTGTAGSVSQTSFSWTHTPVGTPKGVLVYTFSNCDASTADVATAVSYGGYQLTAVPSGRALDSAGEPGDCKAWMLSGYGHDATGAWIGASSPGFSTTAIYSVAYGNGTWVAVGASGKIRCATDPMGTWTAATSPGFGTSTINSVAYGNGTWVAVGASGSVRYATDPTGTWTAATSPGFGSTEVFCVAYGKDQSGNGIWVAGGNSGTLRYATDPTGTWTAVTSPGFGTNYITALTYDGAWVAGGNSGSLRHADNGDPTGTWLEATIAGFGTNYIASIDHDPSGKWIAVGANGSVRQADYYGGAWLAATSPGFGTSTVRGVAYGNGTWVAVGDSGKLRYATDPAGTWSAATAPGFGTSTVRGVAYGNGVWVAVGDSGLISCATNVPVALPTGAQSVVVTRTNTTDEMYAVAITVTADYEVEVTGVSAVSADASGGTVALAGTSVSDGSPGTKSMRFAGVNSGLSAPPTVNSGTTAVADIDYGTRVIAVARETSASEGSTSIGWTAAADDVAAVYLAIREAIVPWTVGVPIR